MKITNTQPGPRGVNTVAGPILVEPNQTIEAKVYAREREHIEAAGWFTIEGGYEADPSDGAVRGPMNDDASTKGALIAKDQEIADLQQTVKAKDAEIVDLQQKLEAATKPAPGDLSVLEKGRGWFAIVRDGVEVTKSLREDDVKDFDKLTDSDKLAFVERHKPE